MRILFLIAVGLLLFARANSDSQSAMRLPSLPFETPVQGEDRRG
jgi:hypothetical protein